MSGTAMDLKAATHGGNPKTANGTATSFGPVAQKGRYQITASGADIFFKPATTQAAAETVTTTGATRGKLLWDGNDAEILLDQGDYVGIITAGVSSTVNLDYMRGY